MYIGELAERIVTELSEEISLSLMAEQEAEKAVRRVLESCEGETIEG